VLFLSPEWIYRYSLWANDYSFRQNANHVSDVDGLLLNAWIDLFIGVLLVGIGVKFRYWIFVLVACYCIFIGIGGLWMRAEGGIISYNEYIFGR
jgi:hypothetical protein